MGGGAVKARRGEQGYGRAVRRVLRVGLGLGLVGWAASAVLRMLHPREAPSPGAGSATWPPLAPRPMADPVLPADEVDVVVAPGVDWAPRADATEEQPQPPEELPPPDVETHEGADAEADAADRSNAPEVPAPDWLPPPDEQASGVGVAHAAAGWVGPVAGACPASHPVKAKVKSSIFHLPGMMNYERTTPDRCYVDAAAAEADGLRAAKR